MAEKTATKASISLTEGYYNESMGFSRRSLSICFVHCDIQYSGIAGMGR